MYNSNRIATRAKAADFNLSAREALEYGSSVWAGIKELADNKNLTPSLATEISVAVGQRSGLPAGDRNLLLATHAPICRPSARDIQKRDLTVASNSGGGYLRATENISFIEMLRNRMVAFEMGARRLSGLVGNVTIPKQTTGATAYWLSTEATAITEGNQVFGQLALTPRTVGGYTEISRLLRLQSSPDIEQIVMSDLALQVAIAGDLAVLAGTGTEQPTGITGTSGVGAVTGTSIDFAKCLEFQTDVAGNNALTPSCGYVTTPAIAVLLQQRVKFANTASPLWEGNASDGKVLGMKAMSSNQCPAGTIIFGDFEQVVIGEWGVLELSTNDAANFPAGITGVRAMYTMDVGLRSAGAFSVATSVT